jgi:hypothetical protein
MQKRGLNFDIIKKGVKSAYKLLIINIIYINKIIALCFKKTFANSHFLRETAAQKHDG